jgi:cytochrome P450
MSTMLDARPVPPVLDFGSAELIRDPWPAFAWLREHDPVHWNEALGGWCLTRYADITQVMKDPRFSSDRIRPFVQHQRRAPAEVVKPLGDVLSLWMTFNDPPLHTRLRKLSNKAFTPKAIAGLRPAVQAIVDELLDDLLKALQAQPGEPVDFIERFAYPLPAYVIAHILGIPRGDISQLKAWSDDIAAFVLVSRNDPDKYERASSSLMAMCGYFGNLIEARRAAPEGKVIDELIAAHEDNDALSLEELISTAVLLLFAGHETTTHFIANGLWALWSHADQRDALRAALVPPGQAGMDQTQILDTALDEILRWDGPSISQLRVMGEDVELHGKLLQRGQRVFLFQAAANRDAEEFVDPERFDLQRTDARKHITFGYGIHFCLGAHLAKLEGAVAFPSLLKALQGVDLANGQPPWSDSLVIRGMHSLPLRLA